METEPLELFLLGPLEARVGGAPAALGGPKQRALLALLALHANDVVSRDVLVEALWEGPPPRAASAFVQNCVHRLRKELGAESIETRAPGYRLRIDPEAVDAPRFERLVREARALPTRERAAALREALALWRGTPLSDLAYWSFAQDAIRNLEEQHVNALQLRLEAELELGLHREAIGELDALVRRHPTHERLRWLQLLALHRSDRRQDALAAYQEARLAIVEESGMEPGEELRALQRRILQDDPSLMLGGTAPSEPSEPRSQLLRKVVAVCIVELLVDEGLDLEAARALTARGLATFEEILLRRRGTVEQLLGEEALAVFGLPVAAEDDPLRALRSAVELRDALGETRLRAAVEWGEVLVDEDSRTISGGALSVARRLKEHAREGEILLGPAIAALAGAVRTEPATGGGVRLLELVEGAPAIRRRPDAPLAGRRAELEKLTIAVRETASTAACRRIVVLGDPGIGKTRLAAELVTVLGEDVRVLTGRCVPYAEGATYLPLAEVVAQVVGDGPRGPAIAALLAGEADAEQAAARLDDALSGSAAVDSGDVFWATRRLLEVIARDRPVLVVLEDVHWAEPTFLDLLEYLVGWSTGAPIALVCLARTELLDARPAWAADTVVLRPLEDAETVALLEALPEARALDRAARAAVVETAEGNPLFLEQLAAHALDDALEPGRVPASLESLLASRLDSLDPPERAVLERAAVVGREFTRGAVEALAPDEAGSTSALLALVRRRLVRPDTDFAPDDAFLFDHALIRDATYAALSKAERARLHERLARWLEQRSELDEIVGYHLEQAALSLRSLGDTADALASEASEHLARAGRRAASARDNQAAITLLGRAAHLLPALATQRLELECELSVPMKSVWESRSAGDLLEDVASRAQELGDRRLELRARVEQIWPWMISGDFDVDAIAGILRDAVAVCDADGDDFGLARAWMMRATTEARLHGRFDLAVDAGRRAADSYARCGMPGAADALVADFVVEGSTPVAEAIAVCDSILTIGDHPARDEAFIFLQLAWLTAALGQFGDAYEFIDRARERYRELGDAMAIVTAVSLCAAAVALLDGDLQVARAAATTGLKEARARDDRAWHTSFLGSLAEVALSEGDHERVLQLTDDARESSNDNDVFDVMAWRKPRVGALAALGRVDEAQTLAREALDLVEATDCLQVRGEARVALAEALVACGRCDEARSVVREAVALFVEKGATFFAQRAEAQIGRYEGGEPDVRAPLPGA